MPQFRPVDALTLDHPLVAHYHDTSKPCIGLRALQADLRAKKDILQSQWQPAYGLPSDKGWRWVADCGSGPDLSSLSKQEIVDLNRVFSLAWDLCTLHFPLDLLIDRHWNCYLAPDICLFLPVRRHSDIYPAEGQSHLFSLIGQSQSEGVILLPFLPITIGRESAHEDMRIFRSAPQHLKGMLRVLLPDATGLLDPAPAGAASA